MSNVHLAKAGVWAVEKKQRFEETLTRSVERTGTYVSWVGCAEFCMDLLLRLA
jgi:hypothetical protein